MNVYDRYVELMNGSEFPIRRLPVSLTTTEEKRYLGNHLEEDVKIEATSNQIRMTPATTFYPLY